VAVLTVLRLRAKNNPTLVSEAVLMATVPAALVPGAIVTVAIPLTLQSAVTPDATSVSLSGPLLIWALML
jgi:hypothetical protein